VIVFCFGALVVNSIQKLRELNAATSWYKLAARSPTIPLDFNVGATIINYLIFLFTILNPPIFVLDPAARLLQLGTIVVFNC